MLSGIKDLDYKILNELDDKDLVNFCLTNKRADEYCNDQNYWFNRIIYRFPYIPFDILKKYKKERTWSNYYIYDLRKIFKDGGLFEIEMAATKGRLDHVMILVNKKINIGSALENAALNGQVHIIKYLHEKGFKLRPLDLIWATKNGHLNVVKYLVENGINVNYKRYGDTALSIANTALSIARENNHYEIVKYLIEKGAKE